MIAVTVSLVVIILVTAWLWYVAYSISKHVKISNEIMKHTVAYEQHPSAATGHFLVAGDSTAVGTGARDSRNSTAGRLGKDFSTTEISNISVNGLKLAGLVQKLVASPDVQYDLILIQIGGNDIVQGTSYKKIRNQLREVIAWAEKHSTHIFIQTCGDVGLAPIFYFPLTTLYTQRTLNVRKIFRGEILKHATVTYIDHYNPRKTEIFNTDVPRYYAPDHFHPSDDGYAVWYERIRKAINSHLKES